MTVAAIKRARGRRPYLSAKLNLAAPSAGSCKVWKAGAARTIKAAQIPAIGGVVAVVIRAPEIECGLIDDVARPILEVLAECGVIENVSKAARVRCERSAGGETRQCGGRGSPALDGDCSHAHRAGQTQLRVRLGGGVKP